MQNSSSYFFNRSVSQKIFFSTLLTGGFTVFIKIQFVPKLAHPPCLFSRVAYNKCISRNTFCNHSTSANKCKLSNIMPTNNCSIRPYRSAFPYNCLSVLIFSVYCTARICDIGKNHRWAEEYIVFADHSGVNGNVVLHFYIFAQQNFRRYNYILPDVASLANFTIRHDMGEVPDLCAFTYLAALIDDGRWMRKVFLFVSHCMI